MYIVYNICFYYVGIYLPVLVSLQVHFYGGKVVKVALQFRGALASTKKVKIISSNRDLNILVENKAISSNVS